jgi:calcium-translocating P-type ATPase
MVALKRGDMFYHTQTIPSIFEQLDTSQKGLSDKSVAARIERYGPNTLPESERRSLLGIIIDQFKSPIIYILLIAALVSFAIKEFSDAYFILGVLFINTLIGTYQEYSAAQKASSLKQIVKTYSHVIRNGTTKRITSDDLTIGDLVLLESGSQVPADMRLIESNELFVNESLLTGESVDVHKDATFLSSEETLPVADRINMVYAGSFVAQGRAKGIVTAIALETEIGKIAELLADASQPKAPLIIRMERFTFNIAKIIGVVILILVVLGIYREMELRDIFFLAVALAVSSIPEGLPVAITVALSAASSAMSRRNVIVRELSSIEGLGSCTMIASDKTGTLTQNMLSVSAFITESKTYKGDEVPAKEMLICAMRCNEANISEHADGLKFHGDQVDIALARYALSHDPTLLQLRDTIPLVQQLPYEPVNGYAQSVYEEDSVFYHYLKGSPETVLERCHIPDEEKERIRTNIIEWASKGYRTIALASKKSTQSCLDDREFVYLGFVAINDPLRPGVAQAVKTAQTAGISIAMITGDHPNTAYYIAKELGIAIDKDEVMNGTQIELWQERGANAKEISHKRVFARVSPEHKQTIVKAFQSLGHFVAVTGDGVNDAPALKYANIGIAMGKSGTDVARESSNLILTDDSFSSIVNGIEEGRIAYDNIRKVIHLLISTGFAEIVLIILSMLFFIPIPLLPVQLLWLNLVTNGIQDVALGLERGEPDVLKRKPRDPKERIFNAIMVRRVIVGGLYMGVSAFAVFYAVLSLGYSESSARNITLLLMVLFENAHVFNSRSEQHSIFRIEHRKNYLLLFSVLFTQLIHISSLYIPFMQKLLDLEPVSFQEWSILTVIALGLVFVMEIEKKLSKI